jgi:hypothetical protein
MLMKCVGCNSEHDHHSWKFKDYEDRKGQIKSGWFCGKHFKPSVKEWVPDRIKQERKAHFKDIVQPWRDNEPSREYIDTYPEQSKKIFTPKERKSAKKVWSDIAPK